MLKTGGDRPPGAAPPPPFLAYAPPEKSAPGLFQTAEIHQRSQKLHGVHSYHIIVGMIDVIA